MGFQWSDVTTLVASNLGKQDDDTVATLMPIWARLFQQTVIQDRNYWFLRQTGTLPLAQGVQAYPLPAGFSEGVTMYLIFKQTNGDSVNAYVELTQLYSRQEIIRLYSPYNSASDQAEPIHFLVKNTEFEVWPVPDKAYLLGADFWGDMREPDDTPSFTNYLMTYFPSLYVNYLTMLGFKYLQEHDDYVLARADVMKEVGDLRARHVARVLGANFTLRPRTDVKGDYRTERGNAWVTYFWGA